MTVYEIINNKILDKIEKAKADGTTFRWIKPWSGGISIPMNYVTHKPYNGCNLLLDAGEYITYNQLQDYKKGLPPEEAEKVKIRKGCHMEQVFFFKVLEDEDDDTKKRFVLRYYNVYNIEDIENLPSHYPVEHYEHTPDKNIERALELINAYCKAEKIDVNIIEDGDQCFYTPVLHSITMVSPVNFKSQEEYIHSLLHECIHSSSKPLKRELGKGFGSVAYSKEELVAELGSAYLMNILGIQNLTDNTVAYLNGWSSYLKDQKTELARASCLAINAVNYFLETAERVLKIEIEK